MAVSTAPKSRRDRLFASKTTTIMGDDEIASVRKIVDEHGTRRAGKMLGLSHFTVISILGRVPIFESSAALVRERLAKLSGPAAT